MDQKYTKFWEDKLSLSVNDSFLIFDVDKPSSKETIVGVASIDRRTGRLDKTHKASLLPGDVSYNVVTILGALKLLAGQYLAIATSSISIGKIFGHDVEKVTNVVLVQISRRPLEDKAEKHSESEYKSMLEQLLSDGSFYYSHGYDLSTSVQRKHLKEKEDIRFDWAYHMRDSFFKIIKADNAHADAKVILKWCSPVIRGFVKINSEIKLQSTFFDYIIISRQSHERSGRRLATRGANKNGQVVNYVESEQILTAPILEKGIREGPVTSYIQVRGSIPLLWKQTPNLAWDPPISFKPTETVQHSVLKNHFTAQLDHYSRQTVVNLVKHKGSEKKLGENFSKHISTEVNENLGYIQFDVHAEVGHTKYENLEKLFSQTNNILNLYGFFSKLYNREEDSFQTYFQKGTIRTNCKDNLDRTNLVQTAFALKVVFYQLDLFLPNSKTTLASNELASFEKLIRMAWADNGDALSIIYAGTAAMRTYHTRLGKVTMRGHWYDVVNSISRYYINNFEDGRNQDAIDLLLVRRKPIHSYKIDWKKYPTKKTNPILAFLTTLFTIIFKMLQPSREIAGGFLCILWMLGVFIVWKLFRLDPNRIIDLPKLKVATSKAKPIITEGQKEEGSMYKIVKKEV